MKFRLSQVKPELPDRRHGWPAPSRKDMLGRPNFFAGVPRLIREYNSLLLRRFVFRMAEARAKRVTGDTPQGRCLLPAFLCAHIDRDVWVRGREYKVPQRRRRRKLHLKSDFTFLKLQRDHHNSLTLSKVGKLSRFEFLRKIFKFKESREKFVVACSRCR